MKTESWNEEIEAFLNLGDAERVRWLADLSSALTIAARDTYVPGSDDVRDARRLRRFNELLHRTVDQLRHLIRGETGYPDRSFLEMVRDVTRDLGVDFLGLKCLM